ncbi:MAG: hypothetical protein K2N51_17025 [Lachnospiraceae bacterium]|nr:hypothetical protein [Lachnospiraceae bacterium]
MGTYREEFKNGDADKSKVIPELLPYPAAYCQEQDGKLPCCECCKETSASSDREPIMEKVKDVKLLCNATLWRINLGDEKYSSISVPTGSEYKTEEYKCLREDEEELIKAFQALKAVQICDVYEDDGYVGCKSNSILKAVKISD